jgi:hypothetical protein
MSFRVRLTVTGDMAADLAEIREGLGSARRANESVGAEAEILTREYIRTKAAPSRHKTADRLGARRTGYLERAGQGVVGSGTDEAAVVEITGEVDIFSRVDGPVVVRARDKLLTIPATAAAYGRSAREIGGLSFLLFRKKGGGFTKALGKVSGKGKNVSRQVFYWLKESVTLPQDRGLLPSDAQYEAAGRRGLDLYVDAVLGRLDDTRGGAVLT